MKAFPLLFTLCLVALTPAAWARLPHSQVALVQDKDGYVNARSGPGDNFKVDRRIPAGQHVLVSSWPSPQDRAELKRDAYRERFRKLCDPNRAFEWRWVITLDRQPKVPPGYAADASYIHGSRLKIVREDGVNWGCIVDPDGFVNIRARPDSAAQIIGKINMTECFIVLDQKAYDQLDFPSAGLMLKATPWTKVFTRDGVVGWVSSKHIGLHDPRDWQFDGPIPYVL